MMEENSTNPKGYGHSASDTLSSLLVPTQNEHVSRREEVLKQAPIPNHIVIIPDGNRRWAKQKGLPSFFGHRAGAKAGEKILKMLLDLRIPCVTFWGSSLSNITKRAPEEVNALFAVYQKQFTKLAKDKRLAKNKVKVEILGRWRELFPEETKEPMEKVIEQTKSHTKAQLTFLMAYSGTEEMIEAIQKITAQKIKNPDLDVDGDLLKKNLFTKNLPPVDLVIRTGGEPHWSDGLLMWDCANAQMYFAKTLWPDFSSEECQKALDYYARTERRMGK